MKILPVRPIFSPSKNCTSGSSRKAAISDNRIGRNSPSVAVCSILVMVDAEEKMAIPEAMAAVRTK